MTRSLWAKFLLILIPVVVLISAGLTAVMLALGYQAMIRDLRADNRSLMQGYAPAMAEMLWTVDESNLNSLMRALVSTPDIACVEVRDFWVDAVHAWPRQGCLDDLSADQKLTEPLMYDQREVGQLALGLSETPVREATRKLLWREVLGALVMVAGLLITVFLAFRAFIGRPLQRLRSAMEQTDRDGHHPLVAWESGDELGQVVRSYNAMINLVQHRTDQLVTTNAALEQEKGEAERALQELNNAHMELNQATQAINDSIRYAGRIQSSLLPAPADLHGVLPQLAVAWQPRDVVSGDFYWIGRLGPQVVVALIDCTGHGVPGAFMTAIAASLLDRVLHDHVQHDPAAILDVLNRMIRRTLRKDDAEVLGDDGLDAAICVIDDSTQQLLFAGSRISLLRVHEGHVERVRGDRHRLGFRETETTPEFQPHTFSLVPGEAFFLYTDGVVGQVGGPQQRMFGARRLQTVLEEVADQPVSTQVDAVMTAVATWQGDGERRDDMTLIGFVPLA